jgi:hypothetical protein
MVCECSPVVQGGGVGGLEPAHAALVARIESLLSYTCCTHCSIEAANLQRPDAEGPNK